MKYCSSIFVFLSTLVISVAAFAEPVTHATFPDVSDKNVAFVYRDAVWIVPISGGEARLLSDIGERVRHPKFSPDGSRIAYSATLNGNQDVFVVDISGGPILRVTNHPSRDDLVDWHVDGEQLLFKSSMASPRAVYNRLFHVSSSGGLPTAFPMPYVETAAQSADGDQILFTYLRDFQEEVWKRYLGGRAPDIWTYDLSTSDSRKLTVDLAPDSVPMLNGDNVYYLSERGSDRRSNLWVFEDSDKDARQVTFFAEDDVRNPSIGNAGIVFEAGGNIYLQRLTANVPERLEISVAIARQERQAKRVSLGDRVEGASIGPDRTIAFEARGDVLIYDVKKHSAINVTHSSDAAERYPSLSPGGNKVAYQSDVSGEYQLYVLDLETQESQQLTEFSSGFRYRPFWSPDGRYLAFMDQQQIIWLVKTASGEIRKLDQGHWRYHWDMPNFRISWSPDSQWLTYSKAGDNRNQSIYAYSVRAGQRIQLTSGFYSDFDPVFDASGNYIAALSYRNFSPTFGDIDPTFVYTNSMVVSLLPLTADAGAPGDINWQMPEKREEVEIDPDDIESRLYVLPIEPGRLSMLTFSDSTLSVTRTNGGSTEILGLQLGRDESRSIWKGEGVRVFDSAGGGTLLQGSGGKMLLLNSADEIGESEIQTGKLSAKIDPGLEFLQMFDDSWRYQRDFFYDPGLHGVDWDAIRAHYRPRAAAAYTEQELTAVVREMHAELAAGHVYVSVEPPYSRSDAENVGMLGVDFEVRDGALAIKRILRPGVRRSEHRSALDSSTLKVREGNFILAVNGRPLSVDIAPWEAFEGLADEEVELTVADSASGLNRRTIRVRTLTSERKLRELDWVERNRQIVDEASGGKIGYIYIPNTGAEGQNELMRMYRAQYHKEALLIDERFNTGGALGDRFVELLNRPPLNYFSSRNANDYPLPELSHRGPKALLINSWSYSGGDGFPFLFKTAGLGPLIGTRTWGGLIGPGMRMSLINSGFISAPPQRVYDIHGEWAAGNEGVKPNVSLQNNPGELARGNDQQLMRAIELLLGEVEKTPEIKIPEYPEQMPLSNSGN
ncbi:MAG: PDZ domain-containing protein [Gammaproteobacteria bacterium]|nr:PDZ domain-containing protein [Gammaproteobacteria bacterium]